MSSPAGGLRNATTLWTIFFLNYGAILDDKATF